MKCLEINLTKYVQDLYIENYKTITERKLSPKGEKSL